MCPRRIETGKTTPADSRIVDYRAFKGSYDGSVSCIRFIRRCLFVPRLHPRKRHGPVCCAFVWLVSPRAAVPAFSAFFFASAAKISFSAACWSAVGTAGLGSSSFMSPRFTRTWSIDFPAIAYAKAKHTQKPNMR